MGDGTDRKKPDPSMGRMVKDDPAGFRMMMGILNGLCPNCGGPVRSNGRGRPKKFCSERCRTAYNHRHANPENWKDTSRMAVCPVCGKEFMATREYGRLRKYCSHACANKGRAVKSGKGMEAKTETVTGKGMETE